jgi:hypothetical protein
LVTARRLLGDIEMKAHDFVAGAEQYQAASQTATRRWAWPFAVLFIGACSALGWAMIAFIVRNAFS